VAGLAQVEQQSAFFDFFAGVKRCLRGRQQG
jgi:hypothetical protein